MILLQALPPHAPALSSPADLPPSLLFSLSLSPDPFALVSSESEFLQEPGCLEEPGETSAASSTPGSPQLTRSQEEEQMQEQEVSAICVVSSLLEELIGAAVLPSPLLLPLEELTFPSLASEGDRRDSDRQDKVTLVRVTLNMREKIIGFSFSTVH